MPRYRVFCMFKTSSLIYNIFLTDDHGLSTMNLKVVHVYHQSERNNLPPKIYMLFEEKNVFFFYKWVSQIELSSLCLNMWVC